MSKSELRIYLGGPINGCTDNEARTWREWFKQLPDDLLYPLAIEWVDPMQRDYRGKELTNYREIVDLDKLDIRSVDALVVMYVKPSVGTAMEMHYAWTIGRPIVVIDQSDKPLSPWLLYHSTAIVNSLQNAKTKLEEWFA